MLGRFLRRQSSSHSLRSSSHSLRSSSHSLRSSSHSLRSSSHSLRSSSHSLRSSSHSLRNRCLDSSLDAKVVATHYEITTDKIIKLFPSTFTLRYFLSHGSIHVQINTCFKVSSTRSFYLTVKIHLIEVVSILKFLKQQCQLLFGYLIRFIAS